NDAPRRELQVRSTLCAAASLTFESWRFCQGQPLVLPTLQSTYFFVGRVSMQPTGTSTINAAKIIQRATSVIVMSSPTDVEFSDVAHTITQFNSL
ncbi:MAG: hypothetical protein WA230_15445, partial [Xanthobacteraceae bacterium]